jgi:glycosyltransferase involved in cell wall biosynthesis
MPEPPELPPIAQAPISAVLVLGSSHAGVKTIVDSWVAALVSLDRDFELIVIESEHWTRALTGVEADARVRLLPSSERPGIGSALRSGIEAARFPLLLYAEVNPSYTSVELKPFLEVIDRVHLVSGVRTTSGRRTRRSWRERLYRLGLRLFFGIRLHDVDCFFKLFRREVFARIPIQSAGPFAHAEILAKANFLGFMMSEVPVPFTPDPGSAPALMSFRERYKDARRVFHHPDFGPAVLPTPAKPTSEIAECENQPESNC